MMQKKIQALKKTAPRQLKQFAYASAAFLCGVFGVLIPWAFTLDYSVWPWAIALVLLGAALLFPRALLVVYIPWMLFAEKFSTINNAVILALIFFLLITPIGLVLRMLGREPIRKGRDNSKNSYRIAVEAEDKKHMEKPF